jgi:hypothetical protein
MTDKEARKYDGNASWETPERPGTVRIICDVLRGNRLELELAWNNVTYMARLDHDEGDRYSGVWEMVSYSTLHRGKATCFLKPGKMGLQVKGVFEDQFRDYLWHARLVEVTEESVSA